MKKITVTIDPKLIELIENHREEIDAAVKRFAEQKSLQITDGLYRDYQKTMLESFRRRYKPRPSIRVVLDHLPYKGGGIITTLYAGRTRK